MKKLKQKIRDKLGDKKIAVIKKLLKVFRVIKNIVCWLLIIALAVSITIFFIVKVSGGTPSVFGYSIHRIVSGSMYPELDVEDVILNKDISDVSEINIGDIVTFDGGSRFDDQKVTHRVIVAPYEDSAGNTYIVTKGDANSIDDGEIKVDKVESKFVAKIGFLRDIYNFFFSKWGLIVFIFLLLLIFFDEIMNIIKLTTARFEAEEEEKAAAESEHPAEESEHKHKESKKKPKKKSKQKKGKGKADIVPAYGGKRPAKKKSKKKSKRKMSKKSKQRNKR